MTGPLPHRRRAPGVLAAVSAASSVVVLAVVLAVVLGVALPGAARAEADVPGSYHVSTVGSDGADGSAQHPWRTLAKATSTAPAGASILVAGGTYDSFVVTQPGQSIAPEAGQHVVVQGHAGVPDTVRISGSGVRVTGLDLTGCVPSPTPPGGFEDGGSSAVRIDDGTTGVVVKNLTIRDSTGVNDHGLPFGCFGVFAHDANAFQVLDSNISGTGTGVYVNGGGRAAVISGNGIHDNHVLIRDTPGGDDDFGAIGVNFAKLDAAPGILAIHNDVSRNVGPSSDYGTDGGAFEIYNASNTRVVANTMADNDVVLETGASPDGGTCTGNVFTGNQASGRTPGGSTTLARGLLLRCATAMLVDHNSFNQLDNWVYDVEANDRFSTNVNGLAITGNTQSQTDPVYRLGVDPLSTGLVVQGNSFPATGPVFAAYADGTTSATLADWQQRTGEDLASIGH